MAYFTIRDINYTSDKLDARTQFHVARRLLPVITSLKDLVTDDLSPEGITASVSNNLDSLEPLLKAVAAMSDEDVNYVIEAAMRVTKRGQLGDAGEVSIWAPVWSQSAKRPMFDDIEMLEMLQIVQAVLSESLRSFFSAGSRTSTG